jgi:hypothetical protein
MNYETFMRGLAKAIAQVEDEQSVACFDPQLLLDGITDTRMGPETKEVLIDLCSFYAQAKMSFMYKDAFDSIMTFNKVELEAGNEND